MGSQRVEHDLATENQLLGLNFQVSARGQWCNIIYMEFWSTPYTQTLTKLDSLSYSTLNTHKEMLGEKFKLFKRVIIKGREENVQIKARERNIEGS